jgi:formamidopyrimidine-DNA glycosylase
MHPSEVRGTQTGTRLHPIGSPRYRPSPIVPADQMPELPEVEHLRQSISGTALAAEVTDVVVFRSDVVRRGRTPIPASSGQLLAGSRISRIDRHGKQLALISVDDQAVILRLGMTGRLLVLDPLSDLPPHSHVIWTLRPAGGHSLRLAFADARRFGGVEPATLAGLRQSWATLGPDALTVRAPQLRSRLATTRRPIKAALLDQRLIAGLGNIYADESLHDARINPGELSSTIAARRITRLARSIRSILRTATAAGGSTIRDYVDARGLSGTYQDGHRVYGRAGLPCTSCGNPLVGDRIVGRMTVSCPRCQPMSPPVRDECVHDMKRRSISSSP